MPDVSFGFSALLVSLRQLLSGYAGVEVHAPLRASSSRLQDRDSCGLEFICHAIGLKTFANLFPLI